MGNRPVIETTTLKVVNADQRQITGAFRTLSNICDEAFSAKMVNR